MFVINSSTQLKMHSTKQFQIRCQYNPSNSTEESSTMRIKKTFWQILEAAVRICFFKVSVLKNFTNFTGKHLCWSLFLTKFLTNVIKTTLQHRHFPVKFTKFFRTLFSTEHFRRLLLHVKWSK